MEKKTIMELSEFRKIAIKVISSSEKRSNEKIYNSIIEQIKKKRKGNISDKEARKAADNMIAMTKKILKLLL